ncbi:MAG: hypothetical protein HZA91_05450 [Verrucomicrobia bacterium]|nr:hypothetical protein [Verrucomicrobiota bacterium]
MKPFVVTMLVSCLALAGLAGCTSNVNGGDRRFFYDSWKAAPDDPSRSTERSHQDIFKEKP